MPRFLFLVFAVELTIAAADWKVGVARLRITPEGPIWMSGYGNRNKASSGVVHDLWAKALAIEDRRGQRVVIVTTDIIGLPRAVSEHIAAEVTRRFGLERSGLLLNSSHTHTGPMVRENLQTMFDLGPEEIERIRAYGDRLTTTLIDAVGAALGDLKPANLRFGKGRATFAINRREFVPGGGVKIGVNPQGPTDHEVPVLAASSEDGQLRAALFGYACHNTTLTGEFYRLSGDYAGFAQIEFEKANPGAAGMFLMLTGGDQNPHPRSQETLAMEHGRALAAAVSDVLAKPMQAVKGPVRSAFQVIELPFQAHSREDFEREASSATGARQRRAKEMLRAYDERRPVTKVSYPVQAIRFGDAVTIVALGGEVVVGYGLRIKREFPKEATVVAGYSNDVMGYVPTEQVLKEGGYEAVDSMIYYGQPGPFAPGIEQRILDSVRSVLARCGRRQ